MFELLRFLLPAAVLSLAACGGGGGGGTTTAPPPPPANSPPIALFSVSPGDGNAPLQVDFDASASSDPDGTISSYSWDFGDGGSSASGPTVSHLYDQPGTFTARLTVTDNDGEASTSSRGIRARGVTVSGSVQILSSSAVDSDVNDRLTTPVSNNDFATAQRIGNPVLLGGYVNLPGTGPRDDNGDYITLGNLFASGDSADVYAINLSGSEQILLTIAEPGADLDLALYDAQGNFVDASLSLQSTESLTVDTAGDYFIEVFPAAAPTNPAGASTYVLSVGQDLTVTARAVSRVSDPFVGGELLLTSSNEREVLTDNNLTQRDQAGRTTLAALGADWHTPAGRPDTARARLNRELSLRTGRGMNARQQLKYSTLQALKTLSSDSRIELVEPNFIRYPHLTPDDPFYGLQWHYPAISLPAAWDITTGAAAPGDDPVIVAVVDTGVLRNHPDLSNQLVPGYDFIRDPARARDGDGIDADPNDAGDLAFTSASSFHGSHVAGTIAAESNNASGVAGVAWNARIMPLRALGVDGGDSFDVIQAVRFAAGLTNNSNTLPDQPADIINLSLGSSFQSESERALYDQVRALGIIVVASAGNSSSSLPSYPAGYAGVVGVSATDINSNLAPYSNFGSSIDVAAPGGFNITDQNGDGIGDGVVSTLGDDSNPGNVQYGYAALNGTSMSAPHVAGVAALMKAVFPALTPQQFDNALLSGQLTDDLGTPGRDDAFGSGLINAQKSVLTALALAAGAGSDPGPILGASTSAMNFGLLATQQQLDVRNLGTGTVQLAEIISSAPWLSASPVAVDGNGLGTYQLDIDRSGLADGSYNAAIRFVPTDTAVNSVSIAVVMQVSTLSLDADAGLVYVLLVDANGDAVGVPDIVEVDGGSYAFVLQDVPPGEFRLFAGTDIDDDSILCDAGDACGAFRTLDSPETIVVDPELTMTIPDLTFVTEFRAIITSTAATADISATDGQSPGIRLPKPTDAAASSNTSTSNRSSQ